MEEGPGATNLQTELNYLDLFKSYCNSSDSGFVGSGGGGCPGLPTIVYMSSGVVRGKESSNRIELSRLVQGLLNFGDLGSLQLWGVGVVGGAPTHVHMHAHTHTCTGMCGKHDNFMQMATTIGESLGIPYDVIHTCLCMCVGGTLSSPLTPIHPSPHPQGGGTPRISKNSITLELIEIFQFCLKI